MDPNPRPHNAFSRIGNFIRGNLRINRKGWKQSGEQEGFNEKAVDALVKKLKQQEGGIDKLKKALSTPGQPSECVTIARSMDGRMQIANRKELPHVIYCRVWRWADLQNHNELRAIKACEYPWSAKKAHICINPYHYERVENGNMLPPILVPKYSEYAPGYSLLPTQQAPETPQMPGNVTFDNASSGASTNGFSTSSLCSSGQNSPMSTISNLSNGNQQQHFQYANTNGMQSPTCYQESNGFAQHQQEMVPVHYEEPQHWATVAYYEMNQRVGEQYRCKTTSYSLTVDGFTNPNCNESNRFCLGLLSNINRNNSVEATRKHIGKGLEVFWENNQLFIRCLSESPIFVQGALANHLHNFDQGTVCKLLKSCTFRIFDGNVFSNMLNECVNNGFEATLALTKMCTVRISFAKGWGANYHRQDVTSTPCWIEIHLNGPLKWLDDVLIQMGTPLYAISSVS